LSGKKLHAFRGAEGGFDAITRALQVQTSPCSHFLMISDAEDGLCLISTILSSNLKSTDDGSTQTANHHRFHSGNEPQSPDR
jgi:hypothetical protein